MSHNPGRLYNTAYGPHTVVTPPRHQQRQQQYYMDEAEDYVADYSESDGLSDHHHHQTFPRRNLQCQQQPLASDITELYRRKSMIPTGAMPLAEERFLQQQAYIPEYYEHQCPPCPLQQHPHHPPHHLPPHLTQHHQQQQTMNVPPVRRVPMSPPYSHSMSMVDPRLSQQRGYYTGAANVGAQGAGHLQPEIYGTGMYRSTPHLPPSRHHVPEGEKPMMPRAVKGSKRYPVTVRTPRYYRRTASSTLYKRPSALCLPVASQPDPAVYSRKMRRLSAAATVEPQHYQQDSQVYSSASAELGKTRSGATIRSVNVHKMDSEGDVEDQRLNYLEEAMMDKTERTKSPAPSGSTRYTSSRSDIAKMAKFFKPKIPPSLKTKTQQQPQQQKQKQDRPVKLKACEMSSELQDNHHDTNAGTTTLQVEEITADSLERLLNQLKKCEVAGTSSSRENIKDQISRMSCNTEKSSEQQGGEDDQDNYEDDEDQTRQENMAKSSPSYNYQDITGHMLHSQCEGSLQNLELSERMAGAGVSPMRRLQVESVQSKNPNCIQKGASTSLDDHCALELHRSKSYIVNLIDRALSKELGTVPNEKCDRNQFEHMNTKKAIDAVNRHTCKKIMENDLCIEITQTLADSIISTATSPSPETAKCDQKASQVCVCSEPEPMYIKQLKQLRWGHLRHIQREARRLEDLERFLDTCAPNHGEE